ncbi:alpha/beta hydrolase [Amycolatopsis rhabdoformis]|uniref:Alpha/beta hydrolase n=1 Tax=Amycolatopsis rhabdoformis TaxID=1448059 RepID=A0ABZ1HYT9_9PSEU|nr:alpha/beta hydrolase [Amycolatopsis rhabdoformis]WSE27301.1 alpha/beta hydrolase [Amycolatopsis rhabdoformis]
MTDYLHVVHDGPPDAPPLLLIHGSGATSGSWSEMVPALAERHHVVRIDLPGCGRSTPPSSYAVPNQAARVAALLDELGLTSVVVVGHSSGGYVAASLAEQRPDLVGSIALISTGPRLDALSHQPLLLRVLLAPPFGPLLWRRRSDDLIRRGIRATMARPADIPDDLVTELRRTSYHAFREVLRHGSAYLGERPMPERLAALDVPVLVVFGAADPRWDPASAQDYATVARVEYLPGVGHVPLVEEPGKTAELLLAFAATRL